MKLSLALNMFRGQAQTSIRHLKMKAVTSKAASCDLANYSRGIKNEAALVDITPFKFY